MVNSAWVQARDLPINPLPLALPDLPGETIMTTDAWILIAGAVGFLVLWLFILPRMGVG
jgi:hypothetical protein